MYALVIILLMAPQFGEAQSIKYKVTLTPSNAMCEMMRVKMLTSIPKELKIVNIKHACIQLGREQKES